MKILHIIITIDRGGAENHLIELITSQIKEKHSVTVFFFLGNPYWLKYLETLGVKVKKLFNPFKISSFIHTNNIEIIHAHLQFAEIISWLSLLIRNSKIKFIISKHNAHYIKQFPIFFQKILLRRISKKANKIIAISNDVKKHLIEEYRIEKEIIEVIYYGIDIKKFEKIDSVECKKIRTSLLDTDSKIVFGSVARLVKEKGLDTLIISFSKIVEEIDCVLLIVGDGELFEQLNTLVFKLGIQDKVIFLGKRDDIPILINCFDIFVLNSRYEGLGLVLLEAMAAGKPIISTKAGAIPEVVRDAGVLVNVDDVEAMANAMRDLANDDGKKSLLVKKGKEIVANFTLESCYINTLRVYET